MDTNAPVLGEPLPVELMNTVWADREGVYDALRDADGVRAWLRSVASRTELMPRDGLDGLGAAELDRLGVRLIGLRDALRRLAAEATEDPRPVAAADAGELGSAVATLNEAAGHTPHWSELAWTPGRPPARHLRAGGLPGAAVVSAIAEDAIVLFGEDAGRRLRACLAPGCVLYFVKRHPRREWCSAACGNRARSARHYERHRRTD
ncbi:ABATE domain-containing protein [Streptomyces sp. NBC_00083]|uniref:CGNR zinc finger domain-containing protein n=1 Tax=Streptomyces sp. NBC_00083 TaxID=2975647 RepID=UPI00225A5B6B|nr:ABATE domain-containing protein [Streptomyces sp. NBC_00083]MCX5387001.1 CGNR zinc finger domain-containing protein [Streptomyces sp. NBC_00083]